MAWTYKRKLAAQALLILAFAGFLSYFDSTHELKLGLDLKGGTQLDYSIDLTNVADADKSQLVEGVKEVIRRRVDNLGVSEPNIYVSNVGQEYHVIVELAGITDLEEAKSVVGKTIQLEFKEEDPNPDNSEQVAWADAAAETFLASLNAGGDFQTLAETQQSENPGEVQFTPYTDSKVDELSEELKTAIEGKAEGSIIGPVTLTGAYTVGANGNLGNVTGTGLVQVVSRSTETEEKEIPETVSARHILISWLGTETTNPDVIRDKDEALILIEDLQTQLAEGANFEDLAKANSDDMGSKATGGDLGNFGRGAMVEEFEEAAFALEAGQVSDIVESDFGYHLIQVYEKQEASTESIDVEKVSLNTVIWNTQASPWKDEAALTGEHFEHADVSFNSAYQPYVSITFDEEGGVIFEELTGNNVGKSIAIFVGGELISAPNVESKISGGQAQISGSFSIEEAQALARDLNTGAIPAPVELVGQHNISATLGQEALDQSMHAGLIGVIILALFMILYYRLPGLIATVALAIYSLLLIFMIKSAVDLTLSLLLSLGIFAYLVHLILKNRDSGGEKFIAFVVSCFALFFLTLVLSSQITLTLAGIAGVVLSIGMAVDANILIFERMKEELRDGRTLHAAIDEGFKRAWDSIRDSNFSSLITCAILFYFGSSIIRGFATNLALGIFVSMFSAILLTKTLLLFTAETGLAKKLWLWGSVKKEPTHWPIMKYSKVWGALSGLLAVVAIVAIFTFGTRLGIDFTGGTSLEVKLNNPEVTNEMVLADVEATETALGEDLGHPQVLSTDEGNVIIRLKHISDEDRIAIISKLKETSPTLEEVRFTTVGPTIGDTLKQKAVMALALASFMIVLYIAFAFRRIPKEVSPWRFGVSAIAALIHDVLIVFGVFVILGHYYGVEMDALFITAVLTVMGFSVHDTIVVFDRIRENLRHREDKETLTETTNKALNQTLARSVNTSLATLITIVAMLVFGPESIRMFVLALTVGITAGTYSSIFIASPVMVWWNNWAAKRR